MEVLRVQKWGNSQGIRLPKKILKDLGIDINDKIEIILNGEEIILKKIKKYTNLDDLFKDYKGDYRKDFDEFEFFGEAQGREFKW
ncbi:AbrB/MazE/SpoVT family DNA-binding domain-containing protein [Fusobacterium animalis]|uniref:AbrB/MazE/SpoVT family DNA-binding domain-containing protein n=1 Tax=Fusobacterium animalis TaxID=76859 RepID=A0A2B7YJE2_9FUSO|nr:AbrB/MazE/SpoVT family DNA-binding domain-containing protein [Fusobacterium animalis]PGH24214.1 AbrB/MazE/SpoVT family DNA-binding domain-containing protein [Fusobacterium animalis]